MPRLQVDQQVTCFPRGIREVSGLAMGIHHIYFDLMKLRLETVGEKIERNARINMEFLVVHCNLSRHEKEIYVILILGGKTKRGQTLMTRV